MHFLRLLLSRIKKYYREEYLLIRLQRKYPTCFVETGVQIKSPNRLILGRNVIIQRNTILHCGGMQWSNYEGYIQIGDDSVISPNCIFYGAGGIGIGKRFECGPGVMIFSSRTDYTPDIVGNKNEQRVFDEVAIGDDVILFAGVIINVGVTIGDGAVVGAGSFVLSNIPPNEVWAGSPARFIKKR